MKTLIRTICSVATMAVAFLFFFGACPSNAQNYAPQMETIVVNGGVTGYCSVRIEYQRIANATGNAAFEKINLANRIDVINERAAETSDDIAIQDITAEMLDFYYEDMYNLPFYDASQTAKIVRGGKYVVFSTHTEVYMGGAHGMYADSHSVYNLSTGDKFDMGYLMYGDWGSRIKQHLYDRCCQQLGDSFMVESLSDMPEPSSYELTDEGVVFVYFPYEISPFCNGNVRVEYSDEELMGLGTPLCW
ncbi:MAG: hypothetical protein J6R01_02930 [Alistipes sp.]|nr:hypothetical protein [Alistipes sp.]